MNKTRTLSRRDFIQFIGGATTATLLPSANSVFANTHNKIKGIAPSTKDEVLLADGLAYRVLISWGEIINERGEKFGFNNDYLNFVEIDNSPDDYLLWVNHEQTLLGYFPTPNRAAEKTRADVDQECRDVGGSILRLKKIEGEWQFIKNDEYNRRIDALTPIPLVADRAILEKTLVQGTLGNCAGGKTPWNTLLTCEENHHYVVGEIDFTKDEREYSFQAQSGWQRFYDMPPEHYGWVVEVDPFTGAVKKHTSMGRFSHESATVVEADDGRCVVYTGDDKTNECIYKFIADKPGSLERGTLYAADTINGLWLPLDININSRLSGHFKDQTDMLIRCREAAKLAGATPQDRPEDIEQDPESAAIFITLTKNAEVGRPYGSILKIVEANNNSLALSFSSSIFLTGGSETGFACPDNLAFDKKGNLWFSSDIAGNQTNKPPYSAFKNNGLFFVAMQGPEAGQVIQVASAPVYAEFTGICFSTDGKSLFLSVQHPGEFSRDLEHLDSHWPEGDNAMPKPSVIVIEGQFLDSFCV